MVWRFCWGSPPGALDAELAQTKPLPRLPEALPVGVAASLARRRPDVREAEAQLHAATANIGVSVAQLFPDLSLTGQFSMRNTDGDYLTHWSSHFYSYGPQVCIPIFQGGRLVSSVRLTRAQQANAVLAYRQTVLTALQDVENALVSYRADQQWADGLEQTADALQNVFNLASNSYPQGISTFIEVLDAQRQLAQAAAPKFFTALFVESAQIIVGGGAHENQATRGDNIATHGKYPRWQRYISMGLENVHIPGPSLPVAPS